MLELALASHTRCSNSLPMFQQVQCDLHTVSVRRRPQDRLRCVGCDALLGADGFARCSHQPILEESCRTCVADARRAGAGAGASTACVRCEDCRNCWAASTFDATRADFCRPLADVAVLALGAWMADPAWPSGRRLSGRDEYKRS